MSQINVYPDTHIFTCFNFLEKPELYCPPNVSYDFIRFVVTLPIVRELERIKDEHWSAGQRSRAKKTLEALEDKASLTWPEKFIFELETGEYNQIGLDNASLNPQSPDDFFLAAVLYYTNLFKSNPHYILTDDVGVRLRAIARKVYAYKPPPEYRYTSEEFNMPQVIKQLIKDLAREISALERGESKP